MRLLPGSGGPERELAYRIWVSGPAEITNPMIATG
jgi:hypothetical protein